MRQALKKLMRHLGPTRQIAFCTRNYTPCFVDMWSRSNISVRRGRVVGVFPNGRVGRGASLWTVANWQPSTDSSPFPLDLELLSHALPLPPPFSFSPSPFLLPLFDRLLHGGNRPETTPLFLPQYERWRGGGNGGGRGRACDSSSKSRGKGEESMDACEFATVHEEASRPTRPFGNTPTTRGRLTDMLEWDYMSKKHGV